MSKSAPALIFAEIFSMRTITGIACGLLLALFSCSPNNVTEDNSLKQYFDEHQVTGTFGQFDNTRGEFTIYDLSRFADSVYVPGNSFDIVNSLIAIETGIMKNDSSVIEGRGNFWDVYANISSYCSADLSLHEAFRGNCTGHFRRLAVRIGKDTMQRWIDSLGYGRRYGKPVINRIDSFWLDNSMKISADEQLGLIKKIYFEQLPVKAWAQRTVSKMMLVEENNLYKLAFKIGTGRNYNGHNSHAIAWVIGWIEENKHPYPFVLLVDSPDPNAQVGTIAADILNKILKHYGFKEGKK